MIKLCRSVFVDCRVAGILSRRSRLCKRVSTIVGYAFHMILKQDGLTSICQKNFLDLFSVAASFDPLRDWYSLIYSRHESRVPTSPIQSVWHVVNSTRVDIDIWHKELFSPLSKLSYNR